MATSSSRVVKAAFEAQGIALPITDILPMRLVGEPVKRSRKYARITASIREIGLVEPLVVTRDRNVPDKYLLLDGHLRLEALKDMGSADAVCMLSTDDEAFTYNKRINRLAIIQEHRMILKAIERGVPEDRIARSLNIEIGTLRMRKTLLRDLQEEPRIVPITKSWHDATEELKRCNIIVGAIDSFKEREQLERFARTHLIPYVDIGMDVHELSNKKFLIGGQVILSMPGKPCLRCCGLITDERLAREAERYGAAGSNPQVVWPNGVLASTAVGLIVQLLTPWFNNPVEFVYLDYDGNRGTLTPNDRMEFLADKVCPHHPANEVGNPLFDIREYSKGVAEREAARLAALKVPKKRSWRRRLFGD